MPAGPVPATGHRELLSSLVDGECPGESADRACRAWKSDVAARADWHVYHLIGDVMRSDDLAASPSADAAFLAALRGRLSGEPVPFAPAPAVATHRPAMRWMSSMAMVAGFAAVGVVVFALRPPTASDAQATWAQAGQGPSAAADSGLFRTAGAPAGAASSQVLVVDGQVIRDARLDAYFEAHRGAVGPVSPAMPGGALRSVEILLPQR